MPCDDPEGGMGAGEVQEEGDICIQTAKLTTL